MTMNRDTAKRLRSSDDPAVATLASHYLLITDVLERAELLVAQFKETAAPDFVEALTLSARSMAAGFGVPEYVATIILMHTITCPQSKVTMLHLADCKMCLNAMHLLWAATPMVRL